MIYYDLETTGTNTDKDRIIEIYALKIDDNGKRDELHYIFNPGIPISEEAARINGFTNDYVKDKPFFEDAGDHIFNFFDNEILIGYNIRKFDNRILSEEFKRCGFNFDLNSRKFIDVYTLWNQLEPRTLQGAIKRFCNETTSDLHGAQKDVNATIRIFEKMKDLFGLNEMSIDELNKIENPDENSICSGKLLKAQNGELIFNFGKQKGKTVKSVSKKDLGYINWLLNEPNMDSEIKFHIAKELNIHK
jgi:DNA polymerase III subunit epsilon